MAEGGLMTTTRFATALAIGGALIGSGCAKKGSGTLESAGEAAAPAASSASSAATSALSGALGPATQLISSLSNSIPGLSQAKAILGVGSMLGLAKAKMPSDQYAQVASAVPGSEALVGEAVKAGLPAASQLTGLSSLTPFLSKAGISPEMVSQLVPALGKAVAAGGGQSVADAFLAALR
jgi:hypothetical protein